MRHDDPQDNENHGPAESDTAGSDSGPGERVSIRAIAGLFLKLGTVAFGGPAVHVALMRREIVGRRQWIEEKRFLQMFAACQIIPGPSSTELAIYIGYRLAGVLGLVLAGALFILPAMAIMLGIAIAYVHFGTTPTVIHALSGVRPVVVAVVTWALVDLGRRILTRTALWVLGLSVMFLSLFGLPPIPLLAAGGAAAVLATRVPRFDIRRGLVLTAKLSAPSVLLAVHVGRLPTLFLTFLKLGAVSYGSGYVLFALLHADFVNGLHWLGNHQLVDAVALGQATPGPVFTTATFLGYLFAGVPGALLATLGIFLPGFCLVPFLDRVIRLVEAHSPARAFLDGVNVGALGLIAAVTVQLGQVSIHDVPTAAIALVALPLMFWQPLATPAFIAAGAVIGTLAGTL